MCGRAYEVLSGYLSAGFASRCSWVAVLCCVVQYHARIQLAFTHTTAGVCVLTHNVSVSQASCQCSTEQQQGSQKDTNCVTCLHFSDLRWCCHTRRLNFLHSCTAACAAQLMLASGAPTRFKSSLQCRCQPLLHVYVELFVWFRSCRVAVQHRLLFALRQQRHHLYMLTAAPLLF